MDKFFVFRKLLDFVNDHYEVVDATMPKFFGDMEITGRDENGSTITIKVNMEEAETNGN